MTSFAKSLAWLVERPLPEGISGGMGPEMGLAGICFLMLFQISMCRVLPKQEVEDKGVVTTSTNAENRIGFPTGDCLVWQSSNHH